MNTYLNAPGTACVLDDFHSLRARELALALREDAVQFAKFLECRKFEGTDIVVFEVEVETPQRPSYDIRQFERLAVLFDAAANTAPEVLALREDFPRTPHINLRDFELPRSLCLYDERFRDVARRWTAPRFVESIRDWLALTAKGKLHQDDQPLEPLMFGQVGTIVLPAEILSAKTQDGPSRLTITATDDEKGKLFLLADHSEGNQIKDGFRVVASVHWCEPQVHGVIRHRPANVEDLAVLLKDAGLDLLKQLRERLRDWKDESNKNSSLLDAHVALVIVMPKTRTSGATSESRDVWAFLSVDTVREAGQKLGVWQIDHGVIGYILGGDGERTGKDLRLDLLNPALRVTRESAAALNRSQPKSSAIVAIGLGALGSQVTMNLARAGYGTWTLIDDDKMLPHNLARHALFGSFVGYPKAESLAYAANSLTDDEEAFTAIVTDVIEPGDSSARVHSVLNEATLILDMSASVTVARHLALKVASPARRASLFLTPTGEDLVLLAEDPTRSVMLDSLEMQYYRALVTDSRLKNHFQPRDQRRRYGQSCRDITSDIPQDLVALHAAIGSRAVKDVVIGDSSQITIWRSGRDGGVGRVDIPVAGSVRHRIGSWTVSIDEALKAEMARLRENKLPLETGGVLLGSFDLENRIIYIVHTISSPPDSEEWPTLYIRGCKGLKREVAETARMTDGILEYIGEWHSHPSGYSTAPSDDDLQVFAWLTTLMDAEGLPAVMMIVGDEATSCFVGEMLKVENLLPNESSAKPPQCGK